MLERIKEPERMLLIQRIENIEQRWKKILQRLVERQDPVSYLLADRFRTLMTVYPEVAPEQFDDWQIGLCTIIRRRARFQDQPVRRIARMKKLVDKARLTYSRFADDRHYLTASV